MRIDVVSVFVGMIMTATSANAALAPDIEKAREISAIIDAVEKAIPEHNVTKVINRKKDQYLVIAGPCSIRAAIITNPYKDGMVGPRQFEIKLFSKRCPN